MRKPRRGVARRREKVRRLGMFQICSWGLRVFLRMDVVVGDGDVVGGVDDWGGGCDIYAIVSELIGRFLHR